MMIGNIGLYMRLEQTRYATYTNCAGAIVDMYMDTTNGGELVLTPYLPQIGWRI